MNLYKYHTNPETLYGWKELFNNKIDVIDPFFFRDMVQYFVENPDKIDNISDNLDNMEHHGSPFSKYIPFVSKHTFNKTMQDILKIAIVHKINPDFNNQTKDRQTGQLYIPDNETYDNIISSFTDMMNNITKKDLIEEIIDVNSYKTNVLYYNSGEMVIRFALFSEIEYYVALYITEKKYDYSNSNFTYFNYLTDWISDEIQIHLEDDEFIVRLIGEEYLL